jgi:hypothetical protein
VLRRTIDKILQSATAAATVSQHFSRDRQLKTRLQSYVCGMSTALWLDISAELQRGM